MTTEMPFLHKCAKNINIPIMMLAGSLDCICTERLVEGVYQNVPSDCRLVKSLPRFTQRLQLLP